MRAVIFQDCEVNVLSYRALVWADFTYLRINRKIADFLGIPLENPLDPLSVTVIWLMSDVESTVNHIIAVYFHTYHFFVGVYNFY